MNIFMIRILILATLTIASYASASEDASIEDTQAFILKHLSYDEVVAYQRHTFQVDFYEECKIRIEEQREWKGEIVLEALLEVSIGDLDVENYVSKGGWISWLTFDKEKNVYYEWKEGKNEKSTGQAHTINFLVYNNDDHKRVLKAMKHLIGLCGGKKKLF